MQSRRAVLRATAGGTSVGLLAALAGCSDETSTDGENGDEDDEAETDGETETETDVLEYTDWTYDPSELSRDSIVAVEMDLNALLEAEPSYAEEFRSDLTERYDESLEAENIDAVVNAGNAEILTGSFDPGAIIDEMSVSEAEGYAGFDLYDEEESSVTVATDGEYLIRSEPSAYQSFDAREEIELLIDTNAGDAARLADESDLFAQLSDGDADGDMEFVHVQSESFAESASDDAVVARRETATVESTGTTIEQRDLYKSEAGVDLDEIESQYQSADVELDDISRDGRLVTIVFEMSTDEYLNTGS
ncbi:hypothetical protein [Haloterrigena gelatinilytica]|uniref:hypothetical protein n=1 Tax=Haloterrigena gelatinilytica TaxID=2741724 RepID=UPI001C2EF262|nr:hypothetical protein [Haloterrigena gelatinilytica]